MVQDTSAITPLWGWAHANLHIRNEYIKCVLAEFLGTFLLCLLVVGATVQQIFMTENANFFYPSFGQFLGYLLAITIFGGISGAHVNPAVTLGFAIVGKLSWIKVPLFILAQFFGGYLGAGLAYALYHNLLSQLCKGFFQSLESVPKCLDDAGVHSAMFAPSPRNTVGIPLLDQVVGTTILMMVILASIDRRNMKIPQFLYGFMVALTYTAINYAFGSNAGGVLNPARDVSPRLMAVSVGFSSESTFNGNSVTGDGRVVPYWLAPLFGPFVGAALGAFIYLFAVAAQLNHDHDGDIEHAGEPRNDSNTRPNWRNRDMPLMSSQPQGPVTPPPPPVHPNIMYGGGGPMQQQRAQYY